ncbi:MAG: protoporphyrinogen oxidase HemJ [Pseudomonadota bacterium]
MYDWILVLHIAAWTSWMAGLFYLPRLFVYHAERGGSNAEMAETFAVMQLKLMRLIMNPAMIVTWATGLWLAYDGFGFQGGWLHAKITLVLGMSAFHGMCAKWRKDLAAGTSEKSGRFFRIANEVPTVIFLLIVILAIVKPF